MNFAVLLFQLCYRDLDWETYGLFVKNNSTSGIVATSPEYFEVSFWTALITKTV